MSKVFIGKLNEGIFGPNNADGNPQNRGVVVQDSVGIYHIMSDIGIVYNFHADAFEYLEEMELVKAEDRHKLREDLMDAQSKLCDAEDEIDRLKSVPQSTTSLRELIGANAKITIELD